MLSVNLGEAVDNVILQNMVLWLQQAGSLGPGLFIVIFILATLFFFPASALAVAAGFLYGSLAGTVVTSLAGLVSAVIAFLVSRYMTRERMQTWSKRFPKAHAINVAVSTDGFRVVFLLRLASVLPFIPLSYVLGLSSISMRRYAIATGLGLLPGTFLYVLIGSLVSEVSQLSAGGESFSSLTGALAVAGSIVVIFTMIMIARTARRALNREITRNTSL